MVVFGEITSNAKVDIKQVVIDTIKSIGYDRDSFDIDNAKIIVNINEQSYRFIDMIKLKISFNEELKKNAIAHKPYKFQKKKMEKYNQDILLYNNKIKKYYDELEEELSNIEELDNYIKQCDECAFFE